MGNDLYLLLDKLTFVKSNVLLYFAIHSYGLCLNLVFCLESNLLRNVYNNSMILKCNLENTLIIHI